MTFVPIRPATAPLLAAFRQRLQRATVWRAVLLVSADALALLAAFLTAAFAPLLLGNHPSDGSYADLFSAERQYRIVEVAGFAAALLVWFYNRGHYQLRLPFWVKTWHVVTGCAFALLSDGFLQFALKHDFSRLWLVHTWLLAVPTVLLVRWGAQEVLRTLDLWDIPVLLVGSPARLDEAAALVRSEERSLGYSIAAVQSLSAFATDRPPSWLETCHSHGAEMVILAADEADLLTYRDLVSRLALERIAFICVQGLGGLPVFSVDAHHFVGREVLLLVGQSQLLHPLGRAIKRLFDYGVAALLLVAALPLFALFGAIVAMDGGPVFYGHRRVGHAGRPFKCLKFRTMVPDAERVLAELLEDPAHRGEWEESHKLQADPRITRIGRFLRAFSLDELPQLFNVLRGEMSLVGPRPIHPDETARFGSELDFYLQVKPGITGLWQVSGRNDLDYTRRVQLNTWYVKNWSLWLDLVILLRTIPTVLSRRGAY